MNLQIFLFRPGPQRRSGAERGGYSGQPRRCSGAEKEGVALGPGRAGAKKEGGGTRTGLRRCSEAEKEGVAPGPAARRGEERGRWHSDWAAALLRGGERGGGTRAGGAAWLRNIFRKRHSKKCRFGNTRPPPRHASTQKAERPSLGKTAPHFAHALRHAPRRPAQRSRSSSRALLRAAFSAFLAALASFFETCFMPRSCSFSTLPATRAS